MFVVLPEKQAVADIYIQKIYKIIEIAESTNLLC